jgi:hypothetical protein
METHVLLVPGIRRGDGLRFQLPDLDRVTLVAVETMGLTFGTAPILVIAAKAGFRLISTRRGGWRDMFNWVPAFAGATGSEPWRQNQPLVMPAQGGIQSISAWAHYLPP